MASTLMIIQFIPLHVKIDHVKQTINGLRYTLVSKFEQWYQIPPNAGSWSIICCLPTSCLTTAAIKAAAASEFIFPQGHPSNIVHAQKNLAHLVPGYNQTSAEDINYQNTWEESYYDSRQGVE